MGHLAGPAPRPASPHGRLAHGPAAPGTHRSVGCDSGSLPGGLPPILGISAESNDAIFLVASLPDGAKAAGIAPDTPESPGSGRRPGGVLVSRLAAGDDIRGLGGSSRGAPDSAQRSRDPSRNENSAPGGAQ